MNPTFQNSKVICWDVPYFLKKKFKVIRQDAPYFWKKFQLFFEMYPTSQKNFKVICWDEPYFPKKKFKVIRQDAPYFQKKIQSNSSRWTLLLKKNSK